MSEQNDPQEVTNLENTNVESPMDSTRMDIRVDDARQLNMTKTSIGRMPGLDRDTIEEKLSGRKTFLEKIGFSRLVRWYTRFRTVKTNQSTLRRSAPLRQASLLGSPMMSAIYPYLYLWVAPPDWKMAPKIGFYTIRLAIVFLGVALNLLLFKNYFEAAEAQNSLSWVMISLAGLSATLTLLSIPLKWSPGYFLGAPLVSILVLANLQVGLSTSTDTNYLQFFGQSLGASFNVFFLALVLLHLFFVFMACPVIWLAILPFLIPALYGVSGLIANQMTGRMLEASWLGSLVFQDIPILFAQPVYVLLQFYFPFCFLLGLLGLIIFWKRLGTYRQHGWLVMFLVITLMSASLGTLVLYQHRLPHWLMVFLVKPDGLGMAELRWNENLIRIESKNYQSQKEKDHLDRYQLRLVPLGLPQEKNDKEHTQDQFVLQITDASGFPILYQQKRDYVVSVNNEKLSQWDMKPLGKTTLPKKSPASKIDRQTSFLVTLPAVKTPTSFEVGDFEMGSTGWFMKVKHDGKDNTSWVAYQYSINDQEPVLHRLESPGLEGQILLGLLEAGDYKIDVTLEDSLGQKFNYKKLLKVASKITNRAWVVSPVQGETVADIFSVTVWPPEDQRSKVQEISISINDDAQPVVAGTSFFNTVNLSGKQGPVKLRVKVRMPDQPEHEEIIEVQAGVPPAAPVFKSPYLGSFVSDSVSVELHPVDVSIDRTQLFINGEEVASWKTDEPAVYNWPLDPTVMAEYLLTSVASGPQGKASSWTWVRTGQGKLKVFPPVGKAKIGPKKVVFILDATSSQQDGFDGQTKWNWQKEIFNKESIIQRLGDSSVGLMAFGASSRSQSNNCQDAQWVVRPETFNRKKARENLDQLKPKGVSALKQAIKQALVSKPQKIIILTDSKDACDSDPSSLVKDLQKTKTTVETISLGSTGAAEYLSRLSMATGGQFHVAEDGEQLIELLQILLGVRYEIYKGDKLVKEAPLDASEIGLMPGKYQLRIKMDPPFVPADFEVLHEFQTELRMMTSAESTTVQEKKEPMR